ncbi:MAG: DNA recombination/repair protein RecA, partial [Chloroflexota bacterium]
LDIRRIQAIKVGSEVVGNRTVVKVKKNKVAAPFTECEFDIMYNEGISRTGDVLDLAVNAGIVDKRGAYFRYKDTLLGQGRENAKEYLTANPALVDEMADIIRSQVGQTVFAKAGGAAAE